MVSTEALAPADAAETLTKGEFAHLLGLSAGRISQYIADGKITAVSLTGSGRNARIIRERALADLGRTLDPAQSFGQNGMATRAALTAHPSPSSAPRGLDAPAPANPLWLAETVADRIGAEKLRQAQLQTLKMERQEALETGQYMLTAEARAAMGSAASRLLVAFESGLSDMADAIAAEHGVPPRDALMTLATAFRRVRAKAAKAFETTRDEALAADAEARAIQAEEDSEDAEDESDEDLTE